MLTGHATSRPLTKLWVGGLLGVVVLIGWLVTTSRVRPAVNATRVETAAVDVEPASAVAQVPPAKRDGSIPDWRGVAVQIQTNYRVRERFEPVLDEIAGLGANAVKISVAAWMEHAGSQAIYIEQRRAPSRDDLLALIRAARADQLQVLLMPVVLLSQPKGREWRGLIDPPDWDRWWADYRKLLIYMADIANEAQAEALLVGSELVSTEQNEPAWRETIRLVRERYSGAIGYSANWDTYQKVQFWDALDFAGMTTYFELAEADGANVQQLRAAWAPIQHDILTWRRQIDKPLVFTEVGWCSQRGAAVQPWNYYRDTTATAEGLEEQRRLYHAFIDTWRGVANVKGVIWWEWGLNQGGENDYGYTPRGKPAERVLRQWFADPAGDTRPRTSQSAPN